MIGERHLLAITRRQKFDVVFRFPQAASMGLLGLMTGSTERMSPMSYLHIDAIIRRAIKLDLIRIDGDLPSQLDLQYLRLLKEIAALLERIRHGLSIRRMMYDYAEICKTRLEEQVQINHARRRPRAFNNSQQLGLAELVKASSELPQNNQIDSNPNILVNCESGTEGELGCRPGYIKVYQAVYCASYGESNFKDVFVQNVRGRNQIVIHPALGGKCNVSIGNPFRIAGWYLNYVNQGSTAALIRMWEIPSEYYVKTLLRFCGTEKQIKDKKHKTKYFVEMCDHKATNQFGIWTHEEKESQMVLTAAGQEFVSKCRDLVTYYDPRGTHEPGKRDGDVRDIHRLFDHLGIPTRQTDRFHDFGMSLSDAEGNLTMNDEAAERDRRLLEVIELLQSSRSDALSNIARLDKEAVRPFANLLSYNNLNPQKFNTSTQFTRTGSSIRNLRYETDFMSLVYHGTHWHMVLRGIVERLVESIDANTPLTRDIEAALPAMCFGCKTYKDVLQRVHAKIGKSKENSHVIDSLNVVLRPLCSGGNVLRLGRVSTKGQKFTVGLLSDLPFEIGKSHRVELAMHERVLDPLDGYKGGGFVPRRGFTNVLSGSVGTSKKSVQLNLHEAVVARLQDAGIPMLGGISGTTRDIFATLDRVIQNESENWLFFNVVAAFMIKHHYHSLVECFIAANQISPITSQALPARTAHGLYRVIAFLSKTAFYP